MKTVFLLYYFDDVAAIFSTRELAEAAQDDFISDYYHIEEWTVHTPEEAK